jgi:hypothetical protein
METTTLKRWAGGLAFVFLSALIMVTASERIYWYLGGATVESIVAIAGFYMIPALAGLWAIGSGPSSRLHQMVFAGAIFGFVVEGVLTPVIYEDGPLPLLAALFVGWHGLLSVVGLWYLARKWLLERRRQALASGAALVGAYWGVWSIVYTNPEALEDFEETFTVMDPGDFTVYAFIVGAVFVAAHWLIGHVWPYRFVPGKRGGRAIVALLVGYAALAVLPVVIWAPIKFAVLVGGTLWLLRRSREKTPDEPSAITALQGRPALRDLVLLMLMPAVATAAYAGMWSLDLSQQGAEDLFELMSLGQMVAGAVFFGWAARQALRSPSDDLVSSGAD